MQRAVNDAQQLAQIQGFAWDMPIKVSMNWVLTFAKIPMSTTATTLLTLISTTIRFVPRLNPDPAVDTFSAGSLLDQSLQTWLSQYVSPDQAKDSSIGGQKRTLEDDKDDSVAKKARI